MQEIRKQTLGGENLCLVQIFVDVLGVWPTKIILDVMLKFLYNLNSNHI